MSDSVRAIVNATRPIGRSVAFVLVTLASLSLLTVETYGATTIQLAASQTGPTIPATPVVGQQSSTQVTAIPDKSVVFASGPTYMWMVVSALYSPSGTPATPTTSGYSAGFANPAAAQTDLLVTAYTAGNWQFILKVAVSGTTSGSYPSGTPVYGEAFVSVAFTVDQKTVLTILRRKDGETDYKMISAANGNTVAGIGEYIDLKVEDSNGKALAEIVWSIPNKSFKDYTANDKTGTLTNLTDKDLKGPQTIQFYWADAGTGTAISVKKEVTVQAKIGGNINTAKTTLTIWRPNSSLVGILSGDVLVAPAKADKIERLILATKTVVGKNITYQAGIQFESQVKVLKGYPEGEFAYVQLTLQRSEAF